MTILLYSGVEIYQQCFGEHCKATSVYFRSSSWNVSF